MTRARAGTISVGPVKDNTFFCWHVIQTRTCLLTETHISSSYNDACVLENAKRASPPSFYCFFFYPYHIPLLLRISKMYWVDCDAIIISLLKALFGAVNQGELVRLDTFRVPGVSMAFLCCQVFDAVHRNLLWLKNISVRGDVFLSPRLNSV